MGSTRALTGAKDASDVTAATGGQSGRGRCSLGAVTVEPIVFLFMLAYGLFDPTTQAFIYYKVCLARINDTTICENLSNGSYEAEENVVQASSSHWLLAAMLSYQIPSFVMSFVYGALSDRVSRKLVLLLPSVGHLIGAAFLLLNALCPQWPMAAVMLCPLAAGLGGGWTTCLLACFSYLSEVSSEESRTFHVVVVETTISASLATSFFFGGVILDRTSYRSVAALMLAFNACTVVYTLARIAEISRTRTAGEEGVTCARFCASVCRPRELRKMAAVVTRRREHSRRLYIVVILAIVVSGHASFQPIICLGYLYVKRYPLGWSQSLYGQYKGTWVAVAGASAIILVPLLKDRLHVAETKTMVASLVSMGLAVLLYGVSVTTWMMFMVPLVAFMMDLQFTLLRSMISKMVEKQELGQVFAVFAGMQGLAEIVSSTLFNNLYPYTLHFWNGLCFLIGAVLCLVPLSLAVWMHRHMHREADLRKPEELMTTEVIIGDDDVIITSHNGQLQTISDDVTDDVTADYDSDAADGLLSLPPHS